MSGRGALNAGLSKLLGLPPRTTKAVLLMRAGGLPTLHVTQLVDELDEGRLKEVHSTFRLVPVDETELKVGTAPPPATPGRLRRLWRWVFNLDHLKHETQREWEDRQW